MQHVSREIALLSSTKVQTYRATKAAFLCERGIFRKRAFAGLWMAFIPPLYPIQMSSCCSPSCLPGVKDSTSVRRILDTRSSSLFSSGWHSLHEYCMKCPTTVLGLLNPFQWHQPAVMWANLPFSLLCLSLRFAWLGNMRSGSVRKTNLSWGLYLYLYIMTLHHHIVMI